MFARSLLLSVTLCTFALPVVAAEPESQVVRGVVLDSQDKPVADATLVLVLRMGRGDKAWQVAGASDAEGRFELAVPVKWLEPGAFYHDRTVWCYAAGHAVSTASAYKQLDQKEDDELSIKLLAEQPVKFAVTAPTGSPHVGCLVQPHHWHSGHIPPQAILDKLATKTDAKGQATMHGVRPDLMRRVAVVSDSYGTQRVLLDKTATPDSDSTISIALADVGSIEGQLICGDKKAIANIQIAIDSMGRGNGYVGAGAEATTDDQGHFRMEHVAEGVYSLFVESNEASKYLPQMNEQVMVDVGKSSKVEVPYAESILVRGSVNAKDSDQKVVGAFVSITYGEQYQRAAVLTDANGTFEARVLPGKVRQQLIVIPKPFRNWIRLPRESNSWDVTADSAPFELPPLEIGEPEVVSGIVVDLTGKPAASVWVSALRENRSIGSSRSNEAGEFELRLPQGTKADRYRLSLPTTGPEWAKVLSESPLVLQMVAPNELVNVKASKSPTPDDKRQPVFPAPQTENGSLIVAKNVLIFEGRSMQWADLAAELDRRSGVNGGDLETVNYARTYGTYQDEARTQEARNWGQLLTDTTGVTVRQLGLILNQPAERYDALTITDVWPPGAKEPIDGRVVDSHGDPVTDAQVILLLPPPATSRLRGIQSVNLRNGQVMSRDNYVMSRTDNNGDFKFDFPTSRTSVMVVAPDGFALVAASSQARKIALAPWSRVTGTLAQDATLGVQTISLSISAKPIGGGPSVSIHMSNGSLDKPSKTFEFAAVPSGQPASVSRTLWREEEGQRLGQRRGQPYRFTPEPEMTHHLEFGSLEVDE